MDEVTLPRNAVVCAARHYIAAHESAKRQEPVHFGAICVECPCLTTCRADWNETAAPIFEAAETYPCVFEAKKQNAQEAEMNIKISLKPDIQCAIARVKKEQTKIKGGQ